ncbi:MAG: L-seryl-tRNA(Sec) selenium transferase [Peptococcaceae bacterium]|nr:L-seryl-tRNA(Sec) selenium transferase [Peptococcaceae bacterium]
MPDNKLLRQIPTVNEIIDSPEIAKMLENYSRELVLEAVRGVLALTRLKIANGNSTTDDNIGWLKKDVLFKEISGYLDTLFRPSLRRVINATGVVLHTNLGRANLSLSAVEAVKMAASGYSNLEINLFDGQRGSRYAHLEKLLARLTGAEAALAVNNNAAAVLLSIGALAKNKEVIVSRGQLVEIGGSFRIPEVMEQSGAIIKEIGTTNRTHPADYQNAINENTGLLLYVHSSNYKIIGFTKETSIKQLVEIGNASGIPVVCDLGSGSLVEMEQFGLPSEITVQEIVNSGVDLITFSGDKLLGGPQSGIILGKSDLIEKIKKNPLTRAVRIDKMAVAALEATLREYLDLKNAVQNIPVLKMLAADEKQLKIRAEILLDLLSSELSLKADVSVEIGISAVGGGAMPGADLSSRLVALKPKTHSPSLVANLLRQGIPSVLCQLKDNRLLFDMRTLLEGEEAQLAEAIINVFSGEITP